MKKISILCLIFLFSIKIWGQQPIDFSIYNTALTLADSIRAYNKIKEPTDTQQRRMYLILGEYLLETKQLKTIDNILQIQKSFKGNSFIWKSFRDENFWEFAVPISSMSRGQMGVESVGNSSVLSKVGNFNATIYADAFAKIIVKRFKQDMNALFFNKMKTEMDRSVELKTLFPNTYDGLRLIDEDIYVFNQYIEGLRQKMEEDLANIFANTTALLETDKYARMFKGNQTARDFLTTVSQFTDGLIRNEHPGHIIEKIHFSDAYDEGEGRDLKAGLQIVQLISAAFRSTTADSTHYWVSGMDSLNLLFKGDGLGAHIWLGTIYQLAVYNDSIPIRFQDTTLRHYINLLYDKKDDFYNMRQYVQGLTRRVNIIEMSLKEMKKTEGQDGKLYWDKMVSSYENILSLVKFAPTIKEILQPDTALPRTWYRGIYIAESLSRVYAEMRGREYHAAIQHIADIIQAIDSRPKYIKNGNKFIRIDTFSSVYTLNNLKKWIPVREYKSFSGTYFMDKQTPVLIDKIYVDDDSLGKRPFENYALKRFIKYSSFAASLVLAKTSDEVADLMESTMTSSGGTHVKESGWLLAVNSYIGLQKTYGHKDSAGYFSISAPIGLNLSYGFKRKPRYALTDMQSFGGFVAPHTIQLFASIIDVGAIAGFRFTNSTDSIPKVKLSNIFSPGLFLQFGRIFNSPLNIGVGYQAQPRLYAIKEESIFLKKFQYRFNLNLSWDIPFWHLKYWGSN